MINIRIVDGAGRSPEEAAAERLNRILFCLKTAGKPIQDGLMLTVRNHFGSIYPGSSHYSPDKVQPSDIRDGDEPYGEISIDVPGVTRAYHDMSIRPRWRRYLTIPIVRAAYGKRAADFPNAFVVKKKDGRMFLAEKQGGQLAVLFRLAQSVFQKQDKRLMPSDETLADNAFARLYAYIGRNAR